MKKNRVITANLISQEKEKGTYVFLKVGKGYVFLNEISNILDLAKVRINRPNIKKFDTDKKKNHHIDEDSIAPYYKKNGYKTLRKIKKDYLLDPRNPIGINH